MSHPATDPLFATAPCRVAPLPGAPDPSDSVLAWYGRHAARFVARTLDRDVGHLRDRFVALLPPHATVLDAGAGSGRDTRAFQLAGLRVTPMEPVAELAAAITRLTGLMVLRRRHEDVADEQCWDGIWAMASLLHLPRTALPAVLDRYARALRPGGIIHASFQEGTADQDGPDRRDPAGDARWFSYYAPDELRGLVERTTPRLHLLSLERTPAPASDGTPRAWLNLLARRAP